MVVGCSGAPDGDVAVAAVTAEVVEEGLFERFLKREERATKRDWEEESLEERRVEAELMVSSEGRRA